jgi:hypothetical protein
MQHLVQRLVLHLLQQEQQLEQKRLMIIKF